jgi:hypothetical protein
VKQIVGYGSVWVVANSTILCCRRVLINEWPLLISMAAPADLIDRWLLQIVFGLPVTIMTVRANHFAFFDRMVRRESGLCVDVGVAFETHLRLINRHRQPSWPRDVRVLDIDDLLHSSVRMRIVTVGASDAVHAVGRGVPRHRWGSLLMTLEAKVRAGLWTDFAMRIMARSAVKAVFPKYLVRMSNLFELGHAAVAPVTDLRRNRPQLK